MFWPRFRKILLYFIGFIFTIFIVLIVLAFVYQNKIKQIAMNEINKNLNGELILKGNISFSFIKHFPNASVSFHQIVLRDKNKNHQPFIEADEFDAGFNTIKIFKGEYKLDAIYLNNSKLNIINYKNGTNNYNVFQSSTEKKSNSTHIEIRKIIINNSTIIIQNQLSKSSSEVLLSKFIGFGDYENDIIKVDYDIEAMISQNSKSIPKFLYNKLIEINANNTR